MGQAIKKLQQRAEARQKLSELMNHSDRVNVIHYSSESFYDRPDGSSPRITSIAIRHLQSGQTFSFSIHQVAERKGYSLNDLEQQYNKLEKIMLDEFYKFINAHSGYLWLHWNMRDIQYGFLAIAHRYQVLGGQPVMIPESNLIDLSRIVYATYGRSYIEHPRLKNLIIKNNIVQKDFLTGEEEATAFKNREYVKLHYSTLRKVDIIANIAQRVDEGTLKTNISWKNNYAIYPASIGEWLKEHWAASIIGAIIAIIGLVLSIISSIK